ncbi:hypothetical protein BHM03_00048009 [Ensete ventricosum]|nr:hypothetical protein BHM03_00048009 [Ensete ventricosum]
MVLFNRVHDIDRVITSVDNKVDLLRREVQRLKEGGDPEAVAATEGQASEGQSLKEVQAILLVPKILGDCSAAAEESHGLVLAECASSSTSIGNEGVRLESVQCLGSLHLGWASSGPLKALIVADLHVGVVGMGVPDVTPPMFKSVSRPSFGRY